ncbi:MAG: acetylornithine deacetylase, partial [Pseudomonadota bacterium]|nr:acetylornithine deacetylase [Pseudomonadota bacterium]
MVTNRRSDPLTRNAIQLLELLVGFDSVSRNPNLPIIALIEDYLDECGISSTRIYSPDKKKCNLLARIGPEEEGGIILSGHTDVVPVDGQDWKSP